MHTLIDLKNNAIAIRCNYQHQLCTLIVRHDPFHSAAVKGVR